MPEEKTMTYNKNRMITHAIPAIIISILLLSMSMIAMTSAVADTDEIDNKKQVDYPGGYDTGEDPLVALGYRPRFASAGSEFIQTPEPMPEDAVIHPYGWTPSTTLSTPTRADYSHYFDGTHLDVYVDTSSSGGGALSSSEKDLLDRIIDDFRNYSWPRVKDYFDPSDNIDHVDFLIHKIDGPSGVGGYYQPGTDEFHLDRDDFSWGGIIAAHEFQHYVHRQYDSNENLWVDEGCADFAAYLVYGITSGISSHVYAYLNWAPRHSLVVSDSTFYADSTTSYYGSSFLFQLYMVEHYGDKNYTHGLVRSTSNGINGVNAGLAASGSSDRFYDAFSKWMVALSVNDDNAGDGDIYSYEQKYYSHGNLRLPLTRSHNGVPITSSLTGNQKISGYGVNSIRFSSPPQDDETYRLELSYSSGSPVGAIYYESNPPRTVEHIDYGGSRSRVIDLEGWGDQYNSFILITSSTSGSDLNYDLDLLDLVPPVTELSINPKLPDGRDGWFVTSPAITLSSESSADIFYKFNNGEEIEYSQPFYVPDGTWNISFYAVDRHENREDYHFIDIKVDTISPTSSIVVEPDMPEDTWYTSPPLITLNTAHPNAIIEYKFGNDDYQTYAEPISPPEGMSTLFWRTVDQAGNTEEEKTRSFKVDTILPTLEYTLYPEVPDGQNGYYRTEPTLSLKSEDAEALYYSIDDGDLIRFVQPIEISDGEHSITLLPIDKAGNRGEETRVDVKVDTVSPVVSGSFEGWEYDRDNSSDWITIAPVLELTGSEEDMEINYTINGDSYQTYDGPIQINEGTTEIWVQGSDEAGNPIEPINYFFNVDLRTPFIEPLVSEEPVNGWYMTDSAKVELSLQGEDERSSPVQIEYKWSGEETEVYREPLNIPEGSNTLLYWATDAAGNKMETRSMDFKKDSKEPSIGLTVNEPPEGVFETGSQVVVDLSSSEDKNGITFYAVDFTGEGSPDWSPNPIFEHSYTEPGRYQITGYVKDPAGNIMEKSSFVEVVAGEDQVSDDIAEDSNVGDGAILFAVIGSVILLLVLIMVLVLVLIKKRPSQNSRDVPNNNSHHSNVTNGSETVPNNTIKRGNIPPPPAPPEHIR